MSTDGSRRGLSLAWKRNDTVSLRNYSSNHIDVDIQDSESTLCWHFMGFYGAPYA